MLSFDVGIAKRIRLFGCISKNPLHFGADRHVDRRRNHLAYRSSKFDLSSNGLDRPPTRHQASKQKTVFTQQTKQHVLRLDLVRPKLTGFVTGKKEDPPGLFGVAVEHED